MNALEIYDTLGAAIADKTVYEAEYGECFDTYSEAMLFNLIVRAKDDDIHLSQVAEALRMICANDI